MIGLDKLREYRELAESARRPMPRGAQIIVALIDECLRLRRVIEDERAAAQMRRSDFYDGDTGP